MAPEPASITLLLGICGTAFLWINRVQVLRVAHCRWLLAGYALMLLGALGAFVGTWGIAPVVAFGASTAALGNWCRLVAPTLSADRS